MNTNETKTNDKPSIWRLALGLGGPLLIAAVVLGPVAAAIVAVPMGLLLRAMVWLAG